MHSPQHHEALFTANFRQIQGHQGETIQPKYFLETERIIPLRVHLAGKLPRNNALLLGKQQEPERANRQPQMDLQGLSELLPEAIPDEKNEGNRRLPRRDVRRLRRDQPIQENRDKRPGKNLQNHPEHQKARGAPVEKRQQPADQRDRAKTPVEIRGVLDRQTREYPQGQQQGECKSSERAGDQGEAGAAARFALLGHGRADPRAAEFSNNQEPLLVGVRQAKQAQGDEEEKPPEDLRRRAENRLARGRGNSPGALEARQNCEEGAASAAENCHSEHRRGARELAGANFSRARRENRELPAVPREFDHTLDAVRARLF